MAGNPLPHSARTLGIVRTGKLIGSMRLTFLIDIRHLLPCEAASGGPSGAFCPFGTIETLQVYITSRETLPSTDLLNF